MAYERNAPSCDPLIHCEIILKSIYSGTLLA